VDTTGKEPILLKFQSVARKLKEGMKLGAVRELL
jgi:hypothetical protein